MNDSDQVFIIFHSMFRSKVETLLKGRIGIDVTDIAESEKPQEVLQTPLSSNQSVLTLSVQDIDFATLEWPADTRSTIIYTSGTTGPPKVGLAEIGKSLGTQIDIIIACRALCR